MPKKARPADVFVVIIVLLLVTSLSLFGLGIIPYPYGLIVLTVMLIARILAMAAG